MQFLSRRFAVSLSLIAMLAIGVSQSLATSGTLLPLNQYQAGTESTNNSLIANPGFEQPLGPANWSTVGSFQAGTPQNLPGDAPANYFGSKAAQGPLGNENNEPNKLTQSIQLAADTDYILSAYLWNFENQNFDLTLAELVDPGDATRTKTVALVPPDGGFDGTVGVFGYKSFNSSFFAASGYVATLEVEYDYFNDLGPHTVPFIAGQIDNVAITPLGSFAPPTPSPEPGAIAVLGMAASASLIRRRRQSRV